MKGAVPKSGQGWRVPALEIERNLAAAVARILDERTAIVADVDKAGLGAHDITRSNCKNDREDVVTRVGENRFSLTRSRNSSTDSRWAGAAS